MIYYNENDPDAANWLQALIDAGEIGFGVVDRRSIVDVKPDDLIGFDQHHFFAGIGGWPLALRIAGWPDTRPVCTGSCPCQPFSQTGLGLGVEDPRHLWPNFFNIIRVRKFPKILGEQVASPAGRGWLAGVRTDLESVGYVVGGADLCAAGVAAPHLRQRLYWVANSAYVDRRPGKRGTQAGARKDIERRRRLAGCGTTVWMGDPDDAGSQGWWLNRNGRYERSPWEAGVGLFGSDKKRRRVEPGILPVAHGVSDRVALIGGPGNAIVPYLAAEFILASEEASA